MPRAVNNKFTDAIQLDFGIATNSPDLVEFTAISGFPNILRDGASSR